MAGGCPHHIHPYDTVRSFPVIQATATFNEKPNSSLKNNRTHSMERVDIVLHRLAPPIMQKPRHLLHLVSVRPHFRQVPELVRIVGMVVEFPLHHVLEVGLEGVLDVRSPLRVTEGVCAYRVPHDGVSAPAVSQVLAVGCLFPSH